MAGESALYKKFRAEQDAADAAYKSWEKDQWNQNGAEWSKLGYTRNDASNNTWGSKWTKTNPIITPPTDPISEVKEEKIPETIARPKEENTTPTTYDWNLTPVWNNVSSQPTKVVAKTTPLSGLNIDPKYGQKVDIKGDFEKFLSWLTGTSVSFNKQGGTMNKVKYFAQGGQPQTLNDIQRQVEALVEAALSGDQKANQQVNQIMEAAKAGDQKAALLAQMIQVAAQKLQGQATMNKWGSKLQYIKSLKFAKGGKNCPACMAAGGSADKNVKVAKKDVDTKTYQKQSFAKKTELDEHRLATETSSNKDGSYNISHKPAAQDSTEIKRSTMSPALSKKYAGKKECGGKAKKHYFGGWL